MNHTGPTAVSTSAQRKASTTSAPSPPQGSLGSKISTAQPSMNSDAFARNSHTPNHANSPFPYSSLSAIGSATALENSMAGKSPGTAILMRRLPKNTTPEALKSMLLFAKDLVGTDFIVGDLEEDVMFQTAIAHFQTADAAREAQAMLNGKPNTAGQANMIVEVIDGSPGASTGRRNTIQEFSSSRGLTHSVSPVGSMGPISRQSSRFNGQFQSLDPRSPDEETTSINGNSHIPSFFSSQSSLASNTLSDRGRVSGKSVIDQDAGDDDTGDILRDPVAYMKHGSAHTARRSTNPQSHGSRFGGLSLSTNMNSSGAQGYMSPRSAMNMQTPTSTMSPTIGNMGPNTGYQLANQHYHRHNYPPVNPADQNPPCNTLYVGNLPIDTSEDELKAMFSKQRGYKRLCFRTKSNGPMCFVEFEDVSFATKALNELYGVSLHNSVKGGIRLSFSKNPLGVRAGQPGSANPSTPMSPQGPTGINGLGLTSSSSFSTASGPPPGLSAPPGLAMPGTIAGNGINALASQMNGINLNGTFSSNGLGAPGMANMRIPVADSMSTAANGPGMTAVYPDFMMGR
ncbi:MAG: hypothetical protein Q9160_008144 [Pyrenula sp. 1 TL-2023]